MPSESGARGTCQSSNGINKLSHQFNLIHLHTRRTRLGIKRFHSLPLSAVSSSVFGSLLSVFRDVNFVALDAAFTMAFFKSCIWLLWITLDFTRPYFYPFNRIIYVIESHNDDIDPQRHLVGTVDLRHEPRAIDEGQSLVNSCSGT